MGKKKRAKRTTVKRKQSGKKTSNGLVIGIVMALVAVMCLGSIFMPSVQNGGTVQQNSGMTTAQADPSTQVEGLKRQIEKDPGSAVLHTKLGNLYFDSGQHGLAIEAYNKSLALNPGNPNVLTDLGVMYRRNGQPKQAIESFDKAIAASPVHETARFNKGIVLYYDMKDKAGAISAWQGLLRVNPNAKTPNGQSVKDMIASM